MPNQLPSRSINTYPPEIYEWLFGAKGSAAIDLVFPVAFSSADGSALYVVPNGLRLMIRNAFWEIITPFTGGAASAIGVSSSIAAVAKGAILGGAGGDVAATLVATGQLAKGTVGSAMSYPPRICLVAGETLLFNQIVSAFTAGSGLVHVAAQLVPAS